MGLKVSNILIFSLLNEKGKEYLKKCIGMLPDANTYEFGKYQIPIFKEANRVLVKKEPNILPTERDFYMFTFSRVIDKKNSEYEWELDSVD